MRRKYNNNIPEEEGCTPGLRNFFFFESVFFLKYSKAVLLCHTRFQPPFPPSTRVHRASPSWHTNDCVPVTSGSCGPARLLALNGFDAANLENGAIHRLLAEDALQVFVKIRICTSRNHMLA